MQIVNGIEVKPFEGVAQIGGGENEACFRRQLRGYGKSTDAVHLDVAAESLYYVERQRLVVDSNAFNCITHARVV